MDRETANLITCGKYKGPVSARDHKEALAMAGNPPDHFILCAEAWAKGLRDLYTDDLLRQPVDGYQYKYTAKVSDDYEYRLTAYPSLGFGPFTPTPYPGGAGEPFAPEPEPKPVPAQCSKCKEPFPYEAHESGQCYRCRKST